MMEIVAPPALRAPPRSPPCERRPLGRLVPPRCPSGTPTGGCAASSSRGAARSLGIVLALTFKFAFRLAGAVVGVLAGIALGADLAWPTWALVAAAVIGGVTGPFLNKMAIVSWTTIVGAPLAVKSAVELFYGSSSYALTMEAASILASTVLLALVGVFSQMPSLRGEDEVPLLRESAS